jgi:PilZ domain-containing protein
LVGFDPKGEDHLFMNGTRTGSRIPLELPVQIRWKTTSGTEHVYDGRTLNISGNGMYIDGPARLRHDTPISFTVYLPLDQTKVPLRIDGRGRVVRSEGGLPLRGIGAIIDDYRIRRARFSA